MNAEPHLIKCENDFDQAAIQVQYQQHQNFLIALADV